MSTLGRMEDRLVAAEKTLGELVAAIKNLETLITHPTQPVTFTTWGYPPVNPIPADYPHGLETPPRTAEVSAGSVDQMQTVTGYPSVWGGIGE